MSSENSHDEHSAAITRLSAGLAIARERETRHWTIKQRREALGEHWPSETARITREADEAVDFLVSALDALLADNERLKAHKISLMRRLAKARKSDA